MENTPKPCSSCCKEPAEQIPVGRVLERLDGFFAQNDLAQAKETLEFWEKEAQKLGDAKGLLAVVNEQLGLYRRLNDASKGLQAVQTALTLLKQIGSRDLASARVYINLATTLRAFDQPQKAAAYYALAEEMLNEQGAQNTFEYATLLNNQSATLQALGLLAQGADCLKRAIAVLKQLGGRDAEIALSLVNLAHITFDADDQAYEKVERMLDEAWEAINAPNQKRDENYAFLISKCAPSFRYFCREPEAKALEETAAEIYGGTR